MFANNFIELLLEALQMWISKDIGMQIRSEGT